MKHRISVTEIRRMTPPELRKDLQVKRAEAAKLRIGLVTQSEKNSGFYRASKRDIARMSMVLCEMEKKPVKAQAEAKISAKKTPKKPSQSAKKSVKDTGSTNSPRHAY